MSLVLKVSLLSLEAEKSYRKVNQTVKNEQTSKAKVNLQNLFYKKTKSKSGLLRGNHQSNFTRQTVITAFRCFTNWYLPMKYFKCFKFNTKVEKGI